MCDPLTLGMLAVGAAGTVANTVGRANAVKDQNAAMRTWENYQEKARIAEQGRQEEFRKGAQGEWEKGLEAAGAEGQKATQEAEAARLAAEMNETTSQGTVEATPVSVADAAIGGGGASGEAQGDIFETDLARGLHDASVSAQKRGEALANLQAYGGSAGGLGTVVPIAQQTAGQGINLFNNFRKGSLAAHAATEAVQPEQISYNNPIADIASSFLAPALTGVGSIAAGGAGLGGSLSGLGKGLASAINGGGTAASSLFPVGPPLAAGIDPWTGLKTVGNKLGTTF